MAGTYWQENNCTIAIDNGLWPCNGADIATGVDNMADEFEVRYDVPVPKPQGGAWIRLYSEDHRVRAQAIQEVE